MMPSSPAVVLLQAVRFATGVDISNLRKLAGSNSDTLNLDIILRILLTYLPESTEPQSYVGFIQDIISGNLSALDEASIPLQQEAELSAEDANRRARGLRLLPLSTPSSAHNGSVDTLTCFLLDRAHRIDAETGSLYFLQQLIEPFIDHSEILRQWMVSTLLPLIRLEYEYHPQETQVYTLAGFEALSGTLGLRALLTASLRRSGGSEYAEYGRDMRGIIAPWIRGDILRRENELQDGTDAPRSSQRTADSAGAENIADAAWAEVDNWLIDIARDDLPTAVAILRQWDGPEEVDYSGWLEDGNEGLEAATNHYAQTAIALVYLPKEGYTAQLCYSLSTAVRRAATFARLEAPPDFRKINMNGSSNLMSSDYLKSISTVHLLPGHLLDSGNPLTTPSQDSIALATLILSSSFLLDSLGDTLSPEAVLSLANFGFEADQQTRMRKLLHRSGAGNNSDDSTWMSIRQKLLWLRDWNSSAIGSQLSRYGVFGRISRVDLELEILKTFLTARRLKLVTETYINTNDPSMPSIEQVQKSILEVALTYFDNASNGNKSRGGVKKASDILSTFEKQCPEYAPFAETQSLIQATHDLSFYSLKLQHGVPFLPVNIRVHQNPLSLIEKVLSQNSGSYTKLDDLLGIGRNLVKARLIKPHEEKRSPTQDLEGQIVAVERQVTAQAIEAALKEGDFDTAYSWVINRLSPSSSIPQGDDNSRAVEDSILWRAAYQAGRYQQQNGTGLSSLRQLEQRMELLSQALFLAPPSSLQEVLATWRTCEEELNTSLALETEEEERWDDKGDKRVPGGFTGDDIVPTTLKPRESTRKAMGEEAPMGLFDVAKGAATALSKSAFPLRAQTTAGRGANTSGGPISPAMSQSEFGEHDSEGRVRKRDMVSSMVTGGLASGIGWVLGAPPPSNE